MTLEKQDIIKSFFLEKDLDDYVIELLYNEFLKPGLILLPSGNTFEKNIYPSLDSLFATLEFQTFNTLGQNTKSHELKKLIHPELQLSHLDELIPDQASGEKHTFAKAIKRSVPNICSQIKDRFFSIDVNNIIQFNNYLKSTGPRVIFAGLGADAANAHFAFIGEEFINSDTTKITLSPETQQQHQCKEAVTIGTDILKINSLEHIYVVAKGESKAESLKAAFMDDTTGLGYVIANHANKLTIIADQEALELL